MASQSFKIDVFEGPLDLLLTLIKEHKLNIYDIEITLLLDQYMEYINNAEYEDYEEASDFLEMAARLIYIKTCSLLPHDEEAKQLKKELEGRLIEYSMCKSAAQNLRKNFAGGEIFVREPVKLPVNKEYSRLHQPMELYTAYMGLSAKSRKAKPLRASMFQPIVSKKVVSVTSKIIYVLKKLYKSGEFDMSRLYDGMTEKSEQVATFLAVLELTKSGRIYLNDDNSKIFFNKASIDKKKKNHLKEEENFSAETTETENTAEENSQESESESEEISDNTEENMDNSDFSEEFLTEETEETAEEYSEEKSDEMEEISCKQAAPLAIQANAFIEEKPVTVEKPEIKNSEQPAMEIYVKLTEEDKEFSVRKEEKIMENTEAIREFPVKRTEEEELTLLKDVFKPNYWGIYDYYWGNSPTGADNTRNYWKYGNTRII